MITKKHLKIAKIASKDLARPVISSVLFKHDQDAHEITIVATDGYKLLEHKVELDEEFTPDFEHILVPAKFVSEVAKTMSGSDTLHVFENKFIVVDKEGNVKHEMRAEHLTDGSYPEYENLIPKYEKKEVVVLDSKLLKEVLSAIDGSVELQVQLNSDGTVHKMGAVTVYEHGFGTETKAVVMPLK